MRNHYLKKSILALAISTSLMAQEGEFIQFDENMVKEVASGKFKVGAMVDSDYGFGINTQLGNVIDLKLGVDGFGADLHIWTMDFKDKSAFLKERPLKFYISGGMGYRWNDNGQGNALIVRTPIGADWQFSKNAWSAYLEVGPSYNFSEKSNGDRSGFRVMSGTGIRYSF